MYGYGAYRTSEMTPPLADCIKRARKEIEDQYEVRAKLLDPKASFTNDWNTLCERIFSDGETATEWDETAEVLRVYGALPEVFALIRVPIVLWLEAKLSFDNHDPQRAWAALVRCNYYLGMCSAHETKRERAARGGRHSAQRTLQLKNMVLERLRSMQTDAYPKKQDVWAILVPEMEAFTPANEKEITREMQVKRWGRDPIDIYRDTFDRRGKPGKSSHGKSYNPAQLIRRWTTGDADIRRELVRVVAGDLNTRASRKK